MASDDKKTKTSPAPKNETAVKKEVVAKKKDEGLPKDKSTSDADLSKAEGGEKAADYPQVIAGARVKNRFRKLIKITGTRFTRRRKRNDNLVIGVRRQSMPVCTENLIRRCFWLWQIKFPVPSLKFPVRPK